jgi:Predicted membrane protein
MQWFKNFEWKKFGRSVYEKTLETDVFGNAAQVAFYFSFAFFPLLLFLVTLFGMILESTTSLQSELYQYLGQIMPGEAFDLVRTTMDEIVKNSSGGKLTLGAFFTLWSASAGVDSLRGALNSVYEVDENRSWWYTKGQSLIITFLFIVMLGIALGALAAGWNMLESAVSLIGYQISSGWVLSVIQWAAIALLLIFVTAVIYSWLPSFEEFHWVWVSPGAVVAILLWAALTGGFRVYLQYFNSYNKAYGSLGAVIILMLWMYLTAMALLIGGSINSVLTEMSEGSGAKEVQMHEKEHAVNELKKQESAKRDKS